MHTDIKSVKYARGVKSLDSLIVQKISSNLSGSCGHAMQCNATREGIIQNLQCDARLDKRRCFGISLDKRNIAPVQSRVIGGDSDWCGIAAQVSALKDIDGLCRSYRRTSFQGSRISALRLEPTLSNVIRGSE